MPGPFPGMDPYLEAPAGWPEVHNSLAYAIFGLLNRKLPRPFYARTERRTVSAASFDLQVTARRVPDGSVFTREWPLTGSVPPRPAIAGVRDAVSPTVVIDPAPAEETDDLVELDFVEVRDGPGPDGLVTAVEVLSYANKLGGQDRQAYTAKQREYADRRVSLVEIDLLRRGGRSAAALPVQALLERAGRRPDYLVMVRREAFGGEGQPRETPAQPVPLWETLPVLPVPLRAGVPDVSLDLQFCWEEVYARGPYDYITDYDGPADPPIPREIADWAAARVAAWRNGGEPPPPPVPAGGPGAAT